MPAWPAWLRCPGSAAAPSPTCCPTCYDMPGPVYSALATRSPPGPRRPDRHRDPAALRARTRHRAAPEPGHRHRRLRPAPRATASWPAAPARAATSPCRRPPGRARRWPAGRPRGDRCSDVIDLSCAALPAPPDLLPEAVAGGRRPARALPARRRLRAGRAARCCATRWPPASPPRGVADPSRADPDHQRRAARARPAAAAAHRPGRPRAHRAAHLPGRARRDPGQRRPGGAGADGPGRRLAGRRSCRPRCARPRPGSPTSPPTSTTRPAR